MTPSAYDSPGLVDGSLALACSTSVVHGPLALACSTSVVDGSLALACSTSAGSPQIARTPYRPRWPDPTLVAMTSRDFRSITSQMAAEHHRAVELGHAAELEGDWAHALALHLSVPFFRRSTYGEQLAVLARLGTTAPGWMVARHLTDLARRRPDREAARRRAVQLGTAIAHPRGLDLAWLDCEHPQQAPSHLWARDWVVRQVELYVTEALADLLAALDPAVTEWAGPVEAWPRARVGGFRVGESDGEVLCLHPARGGAEVQVLDLGLTEQVPTGSFVLGRVVPVDSEPGRVLEGRPLPVDEQTATAVSRNPDGWPPILQTRSRAGRIPAGATYLSESTCLTDLPHQAWKGLLGGLYDDLDRPLDDPPERLVGRALEGALRLARGGVDGVRPRRHQVAALLLEPDLDEVRMGRYAHPRHLEQWQALADVVPPHVRGTCEEMVVWCAAVDAQAG